jgi:general secretion pathway protein N
MKRLLGYLSVGLIAYAIFLIIQFPAAAMLDLMAGRVPGFTARDAQGSALGGSAQDIHLGNTRFESLSWRLHVLGLFLGRLEYHFSLREPELQLQGRVATALDRHLYFEELKGNLPLSKISALLGYPSLPVNGQLELQAADFGLNPAGRLSSVSGMIRLLGAHTALGKPLELGDFSADFITRGSDVVGNIRDEGGPVELKGTLTLTPQRSYRFTGQAALRADDNRELRQALSILGRPGGDGKWKINLAGMM